jgi:branched-chain amino acid transport system permease protein
MKSKAGRIIEPVVWIAVIVAFLSVPMLTTPYTVHLFTRTLIYAILAMALNLITGYTGLLSLGHAGFAGIGGYTAAVLMVDAGFSFWAALPLSIIAGCLAGFLIGIPSLRVRGHSFIIVTLAFGMILYTIMNTWDSVTRGAEGFPGIPRPDAITLFDWVIDFGTLNGFYGLVLATAILVFAFQRLLVFSNFGRILMAIRQDETLAAFKGVNTAQYKLASFIISAGIASLGGVFTVSFLQVGSPLSFDFLESINYVLMAIIGGAGFLAGPILGAFVFIAIPEYLRVADEYRLVFFGFILLIVTQFERKGLSGLIADQYQRLKE